MNVMEITFVVACAGVVAWTGWAMRRIVQEKKLERIALERIAAGLD